MGTVLLQTSHSTDMKSIKKSVFWIYYVIFFAVLNESIFNVATPTIAKQFALNTAGVSWVVTIFFIIFGLGTVIYGKLADIYSIKTLITIGIVMYSIGSLAGFVLHSWFLAVIVARAIQGAGGSALPALVFIIVARFFTQQERGKMFGIITSTVSFAIGIGPVLGGYIAGSWNWMYLFLMPLPILISIPFFRRFLPDEPRRPGKLDVRGALWLAVAVSSLILFTIESQWIYAVVTGIALVLFILRILRVKEPFVAPALFKNTRYRNALVIGFLIFGTVMSAMFVTPLMLSKIYQLDTQEIGLVMFPGAFSAVIFGRVAGQMTVKRGSHFVVYLGLLLLAGSLILVSGSIGGWVWFIAVYLVTLYVGFSFVQTALTESVTEVLDKDQIGVGMGLYNMVSIVAGAIVTALVAKVMTQKIFVFRMNPFLSDTYAFPYGNLILMLSIVVMVSALLYFLSFGKRISQTEDEAV
ncbi:MFS transporter [Alicyclobacillus sp. SO9]|uniref:MFS transporter n=1 Tax=Alicyclobacillus sp. SO9 TaxID=2665646 RepID=UPI0018E7DE8A|nr:MFS transporter [Alicyclobacillus sp. SO9]QQE78319.1 MFS transporter [Alicyclobacillus sp. SO9]